MFWERFSQLCEEKGTKPNTLKELMRHSSIDMQEHYKHTTAQEVLDKINELAFWH